MSTSHRLILSLAGIVFGGSALAVQPPEPPAPQAAPAAPSKKINISMGSGDGYALVDSSDDSVTMAGSDVDGQQIKQLQRSLKGQFLWFRDQGKSYVIEDRTLLARADAAWKPVRALGQEMSALGQQMGEQGRHMAKLGREMGEQGRQDRGGEAAMTAKTRQMDEAAKPMDSLGKRMGELGERQGRVSKEAERATRVLIDEALRAGKARPVGAG